MALMMKMILVIYSGPTTVLSISHSLFHLFSQVGTVIIPILEVKGLRCQNRPRALPSGRGGAGTSRSGRGGAGTCIFCGSRVQPLP